MLHLEAIVQIALMELYLLEFVILQVFHSKNLLIDQMLGEELQ